MQALLTGIYSEFTGTRTLYFHEAPQGSTLPYHVYQLISDVPEYLLQSEEKEEVLFQFNSFSDSSSATEVCAMFEEIKTIYDNCNLTVTGYTTVSCDREISRLIGGPGDWQYVTQYRVKLER